LDWRISQSEIQKIVAAKKEAAKARAGKKLVLSVAEGFLPPNPLPFCPPERNFGKAPARRRRRRATKSRQRDFLENEF